VILCTDGDFNVGVSSDADLTALIEKKRRRRFSFGARFWDG